MKLLPIHCEGARGMLKLTQQQLADAADVNKDTIRYFEEGRTTPHEKTLRRIQEALEQRGIVFTFGDKPGVQFDPSRVVIRS